MRACARISFGLFLGLWAYRAQGSGVDFDVRVFGARGDGFTKDTVAIQNAIDAAAAVGGGRVILTRGVYLSGSLFLRDNIEFHLDEGAILMGSPDQTDYNAADVCPQNGASPIEGDNMSGGHLLLAIERRNVCLTGPGMIDGNVTAFFLGKYEDGIWPDNKRAVKWRPGQMIFFVECDGVIIRNVSLRNSPYWSCFLYGCVNVEIDGADVKTMRTPRTYNGDGLDVDCCEHVCIRNCRIRTDDDSITLRCEPSRLKKSRPCRDIRVSDCELSSLCNCLRVGVGTGTVENVVVERIKVEECRIAINITGTYTSGSRVGGRFRNLTFRDWSGECWWNFIKIYPGPTATTALDYTLEGITFENVSGRGYRPSEVIGPSVGNPGVVSFRNVKIKDMQTNVEMDTVSSNVVLSVQ